MDARLENRLANADPKCSNCGWWTGGQSSAGKCDRHDITTLSLAVCHDWRDGEPVQNVLKRDE